MGILILQEAGDEGLPERPRATGYQDRRTLQISHVLTPNQRNDRHLQPGTIPSENNAATIIAMTFEETFHERIALRCDATAAIGVGHVVRCVALGQELRARGFDVVLWGRIDGIEWLSDLVAESGLRRLPAADGVSAQVHEADAAGFAGVVLDGYHLPAALG